MRLKPDSLRLRRLINRDAGQHYKLFCRIQRVQGEGLSLLVIVRHHLVTQE